MAISIKGFCKKLKDEKIPKGDIARNYLTSVIDPYLWEEGDEYRLLSLETITWFHFCKYFIEASKAQEIPDDDGCWLGALRKFWVAWYHANHPGLEFSKEMGCVYFFRLQGTDIYKIGRTSNVSQRKINVEAEARGKVICVNWIYTSWPGVIEKDLHKALGKYRRLGGEWFNLSEEQVEEAVMYASLFCEQSVIRRAHRKFYSLWASLELIGTDNAYEHRMDGIRGIVWNSRLITSPSRQIERRHARRNRSLWLNM